MRNSQAKHVYVYDWGGAREGGCTKDLSQEKGIIWGGGQKSFHVVCTLCVCVCVREREREREREETTACNKHKTLCWKRVISHFFQQAAFSAFPCLGASAGILAAIFYFPYPDLFSLWLASRTFVESKPTI